MKLTDNEIRDITRYLGLFPTIVDEAKAKGIDLAMNYSSRDMFGNDKMKV